MSSFWAFITVVVCLSIIGEFVVRIIKAARSGGASSKSEQHIKELVEDVSGMEQELDDLRARIVVLEQIVTDDKYHLDKEISNLA